MAANWTLEWNGQVKTLAAWGLTRTRIRFASQGADVATFKFTGVWEDADRLFQYGDAIRILRDGAPWWAGNIVQRPMQVSAAREEMMFEARGPWWFFERHEFQVPWPSWDGVSKTEIFNTHIIYNTSDGTTLISTRETMKLVLNYLLSQYAAGAKPFQYADANILPGVNLFVPPHEDRDLTCAGVIRQLLQWHRDAVVRFDYSQTPPALHIGRHSALTEVNLALPRSGANGPIETYELQEREDLQRPSVVIRYERRNVTNGTPRLQIVVDAHPPGATGREADAWTMSVDLLGFNKTTVAASLSCRTKNYFDIGWWRNHEPFLSSDNISVTNIEGVKVKTPNQFLTGSAPLFEVPDPERYPNELVDGVIAPWMELEDGTAVESRREIMTALATYDYWSGPPNAAGSILIESGVTREVRAQITATNAPTGESRYETTERVEGGDPQPIGLAQYLYEQVNQAQWAGAITLAEEEVGGQVRIGNVVNITGGRAEWATMRAMVQSVVEDIDNGATMIELGPPEHLGIQDLVELLKVGRRRSTWTNPKVMEEGELLDDLTLGNVAANNDSGMGAGQRSYMVFTPDKTPTVVGQESKYDHVAIDGRGTAIAMARKDKPGKIQISLGTGPQGNPPNQLPKLIISADPDNAAANLGSVIIDLAALANIPAAARVITLREVCVKVGTAEKKMIVLGGEPY